MAEFDTLAAQRLLADAAAGRYSHRDLVRHGLGLGLSMAAIGRLLTIEAAAARRARVGAA